MKSKFMFDHIAINVEDIERAVEWYKTKLDAKVHYKDETWALLKVGPTSLALTLPTQHPPHVAFRVDKINDIPSKNIKEHRDGSKYVYLKDSENNTIEIIFWPKQ